MHYRTDMGLAGVTLAALSPDLGAPGVVAQGVALFDLHLLYWTWRGQLVFLTAPHVIAIITLLVLLGRTFVALGSHVHDCARRRELRARYERRQLRAQQQAVSPPPAPDDAPPSHG